MSRHSRGTFNPNGGTLQIGPGSGAILGNGIIFMQNFSSGSLDLNNLNFFSDSNEANAPTAVAGNFQVNGTLSLNNGDIAGGEPVYLQTVYGYPMANIYAAGDVNANTGAGGNFFQVNIVLNGNNNTQTLTGTANGALPLVTIAHTGSGAVDFAGTIVTTGGINWTSGTVNAGTSTVQLGTGNSNYDTGISMNPGDSAITFYNLSLVSNSSDAYILSNLYVTGTLTINSPSGNDLRMGYSGDNLYLGGNLVITQGTVASYASSELVFNGTGAQTMSQTSTSTSLVPIVIDNVGGSVTLDSNFTSEALTVQSGSLDLNGYALKVSGSLTLDAPGIINCDGGCGSAPVHVSGAGSGDLKWTSLTNGGTINP